MGLLDGDLATAIYRGFKGKLLKGVLRKQITPESGALDDLGDDMDAPAPIDYAIEGFTEEYTDMFRAQAGIPIGDLKLNIFGTPLRAKGIRPGKDDKAALDRKGVRQWYQIRKPMTDPAEALWTCQAFEIRAPA